MILEGYEVPATDIAFIYNTRNYNSFGLACCIS